MKALFKGTGEIIEVTQVGTGTHLYDLKDIDWIDDAPGYEERLLNQYAGMAMQGMLSNISFMKISEDAIERGERVKDITARTAIEFATALVEKLKEEEERK